LGKASIASSNHHVPGTVCPVCNTKNVYFQPLSPFFFREMDKHGFIHSVFLFETINMEAYTCSVCKANDRERLFAMYMNKNLVPVIKDKDISILEIAPSPSFTAYMKKNPRVHVRTTDLFMQGVDDVTDITNMHIYQDGQFDVFICSHVLEHIPDDIAAMKELYRILAPNGWGLAMVPINLGLENVYEDAGITDAAGRWKHFGQDDHVRMYSKKGFTERLCSVGFVVNEYGIDYFGAAAFEKHGIHPRSVLYIVSK